MQSKICEWVRQESISQEHCATQTQLKTVPKAHIQVGLALADRKQGNKIEVWGGLSKIVVVSDQNGRRFICMNQ